MSDIKYLQTHEWYLIKEEALTVGISDFAQNELGDIVSIVGGRLYTDESKDDPELVTKEELGSCEKIIITKDLSYLIKITKDVDVICHAAAYAHEGLSSFSPTLI